MVITVLNWCAICTAGAYFIVRLRKIRRIFVPDFKRGVKFVNGSFTIELGPGHYELTGSKEHIEVVDMRPQPIILKRIVYRDAWQNDAMATVSAELSVCNAKQAATLLKNQVPDAMPMLNDSVRSSLARTITQDNPEFREAAAADITQAVNDELNRLGMTIGNVEIIESCFRPASVQMKGVTQ